MIDPRQAKAGIVAVDGARLRELRRQRGLSQFTLASRAGVDVSTVARLERHSGPALCRFYVRRRLADALGEQTHSLEPSAAAGDQKCQVSAVAQTAGTSRP